MLYGRTFNILVPYFNSHQMENSMFQLRFQCGRPMAGPHGPDRPSKLFTSLLTSFATSSHVSNVCGPELSFRAASFLARRFKWKMPNFCQVPVVIIVAHPGSFCPKGLNFASHQTTHLVGRSGYARCSVNAGWPYPETIR